MIILISYSLSPLPLRRKSLANHVGNFFGRTEDLFVPQFRFDIWDLAQETLILGCFSSLKFRLRDGTLIGLGKTDLFRLHL